MRRAPLLLCLLACGAPAGGRDGAGTVVSVVDGDTVVVEVRGRAEHVRLIGIDTPEVHGAAGLPECFGPEASAHVTELLPPGTAVRLVRDVVGRDDYGRLLAYVYLADGTMVNEALVDAGFATPLTITPNDAFRSRFVAAAHRAERAGLGLWSACGG